MIDWTTLGYWVTDASTEVTYTNTTWQVRPIDSINLTIPTVIGGKYEAELTGAFVLTSASTGTGGASTQVIAYLYKDSFQSSDAGQLVGGLAPTAIKTGLLNNSNYNMYTPVMTKRVFTADSTSMTLYPGFGWGGSGAGNRVGRILGGARIVVRRIG